jgi:Fe-S-cluster containining protein
MTICQTTNCSLCCRNREVILTKKDVTKLLTFGHYEQVFAKPSRHGMGLKEMIFVDGECVFLKNDKCSVYDNRPTACRIFPYTSDGNKGSIDPECPHAAEFKADPAFLPYAESGMKEIISDVERTIRSSRKVEA